MKKKEIKEKVEEAPVEEVVVVKIELLTQEFGNGDMNTLRDKINELIKLIF